MTVHKPYVAFFVGTPTPQEQALLQSTQLLVDFEVVAKTETATMQVRQTCPDYVMLPLTYADKLVLQLFHELRQDGRICVVVWGEQTLTAFSGRGYRWRREAPKTIFGFERLIEWGKWPLPVNYRRVGLVRHEMATATYPVAEPVPGLGFADALQPRYA